MATDKRTLEMLARVAAGHPDYMAWLKARQQNYHVDVVNQRDEISLRWAQGRAQELTDQVGILETASSLL